ncbi:MAG: beta-propeller fold lactonase family protein [Armatimonadetes bacterium]|nr:beta-propeller fold lactonase family protein [Armatimonadota bacterium]
MTAFHWHPAAGSLTEFQTESTLPPGWTGTNYPADVHLTRDGRHLYGSNRGHHSLAVYALDHDGRMSQVEVPLCGGEWPRNFAIVPDQRFVLCANERSDNVVTFARDAGTGRLTPTGAVCEVPKPVCLCFAG